MGTVSGIAGVLDVAVVSGGGGGGGGSAPFQIGATLTTTASGSYVAGNCIGGLISLSGCTKTNGGGGTILSIKLKSNSGAAPSVAVYAFAKSPAATITDKTAYAASTSDNLTQIPGFPLTGTLAAIANTNDTASYLNLTGIDETFVNQDSTLGTDIYLAIIATSAFTAAASTADWSVVVTGYKDA
jgi:hypothetical protein